MDLYGLFVCVGLFLCSVDGFNAINCFKQWYKMYF